MTEANPQIQPDVMAALASYADTVRRVCYLYLKHREDVEDVFQDVFIKYMQRTEPFAKAEHEKAWIIRVTINCCKDLVGSFWRNRVLPLNEDQLSVTPVESRGLMEAVLRLPEKERTAIYLFYYEGYAATEIAAMTKQKVNTVYSHLHRAKSRLRGYLEGIEGLDDEQSNQAGV